MYIERVYKPQKKIIIFTGAGLSAESGISTFRDNNGLWENHKIEEVCNINTWKKNYDLVHNFYNQRRTQLKDCQPNLAHHIIKEIEDKYTEETIIITQNVDDLLEKAGCKNILHVHGNLKEMQCLACGKNFNINYDEWNVKKSECSCGSKKGVKPNIVFFYESAPMYRYMYRAFDHLMHPDSILIVIGTLGNIIPINHIIGDTKKVVKSLNILNNLEKSQYINDNLFDYTFYEKATIALPKIKDIIFNQ